MKNRFSFLPSLISIILLFGCQYSTVSHSSKKGKRRVLPPSEAVYSLRTDTFDIYGLTNLGAELRLQNSSRNVKGGVLTNTNDSGLTKFEKLDLVKVGTTGIGIVGQDTITLDKLQYYLPMTGGNLTGGLGIQYAAGNKHLIAMNLSNTSSSGSKGFDVSSYYLGLGHREWGVGTLRLMGMGFRYNFTDHYPAVIGYQETSGSSSTFGDLIFATRNVTTNTAPTIRMRITAAGNTKAYGPVTAPEDVATKGYVDTAYMPVKTITFTGTYSLNGTPSNTFIRNNASAANTVTLPTAKDGITYSILKIGSSVMTIEGAIMDAGKNGTKIVSGTETGSTITLRCSSNMWSIISRNGTWTTQ